jgi:hypothetical protein
MSLASVVAFWRVEKTTITGWICMASAFVAFSGQPGPMQIHWPNWVLMTSYWSAFISGGGFCAWVKTRGVTGGDITPQGNTAPKVTMVEAAKSGAPPVPVQPAGEKES